MRGKIKSRYLHMSVTVLSNHVSPFHERLLQTFESSFPEPDVPSHINGHDTALIPLSQQSICVRNSRYPCGIWWERLCTERRAQRKVRSYAEQAGDASMGVRLPDPLPLPQEMCSFSLAELHLFFSNAGLFSICSYPSHSTEHPEVCAMKVDAQTQIGAD